MNDRIAPAELPAFDMVHILANANAMTEKSPERRKGISDLEFASTLLSRAVQYLSTEQRAGRCTSVRANRQAITVLCDCAEGLAIAEQREPARRALYGWLDRARRP